MTRNIRSPSMRKEAGDGTSWTPTERRKRDQLLSQYLKGDVPLINSKAFQDGYDQIKWGDDTPACETCGHTGMCHPSGRCFMKGCQCWDMKKEAKRRQS